MPDKTIGKAVQRGTICKDRWKATVTIVAPDRIPLNGTAPLFLTIAWRDERGAVGRPDDAKPIRLEFKPERTAGGGDIVFNDANGPRFASFETDIETTLTLFGKAGSAGAKPDVSLVITIEGEEQTPPMLMSVGDPEIAIRIEKAGGGPLPNYLPIDSTVRIKAVPAPPKPGKFRWVSPIKDTLVFSNDPAKDEVDVVLKRAPARSTRFVPAVVLFQPEGTADIYMGVHQFDARESIAFVMGAPEKKGNQFYTGAIAYLILNPIGQLELNQRSLKEVRDYLETHAPANGLPWGDVHVVVHATEEGFMETLIVPGGRFADPLTIQPFVGSGALALPDRLLDRQSVIRIRGCSVGRSAEMLKALSKAFGGDDPERPVVRAPRHLQRYEFFPGTFFPGGTAPASADEFLLELFLLGFPSDKAPKEAELRSMFEKEFPGAADRTKVAFEKKIRKFEVKHEFDYLPLPKNNADLTGLVRLLVDADATKVKETGRSQTEGGQTRIDVDYEKGGKPFFGHVLIDPNPPPDDAGRQALLRKELTKEMGAEVTERLLALFQWTPEPKDSPIDGGRRLFVVKFHGSRTVYRFSRELTEPDPDNPGKRRRARPAITDPAHFGAEIPQ